MAEFHATPVTRERRLYTVMRDLMKTLGLIFLLTFLGGAVSAGAAESTLPSRPVLPRDTGIAPPTRIHAVPTESTQPQGTPVATAEVPQTVRRAVVADAAKRFNVAVSAVVVVRAEQVTWGDGSLGCPERGMYYTQNLVPGYVIVAKTDAGELVYHTDTREQAKSCDSGLPTRLRKPPDQAPVRSTQPPVDR
jgi:hypothetical protein